MDGRVALVTGGARGQGRSHALAMAAECAAVVVCDIAADLDVVPYPLASRSDLEERPFALSRLRGSARWAWWRTCAIPTRCRVSSSA